ncbi:MAG: hypothetical protein A2149_03495 [Candidatus Schekmanbacteria bacterium RBG_16_38_11]|uniref:L,D-TPase catalytic domain-containing protein n=1 Tax=Candidatus Schekmanbacteria bacterium RBG_16_38_11 TaxID=1817880 RepID=A0A1F7RXD9_9BACT|nr:MAG: hypothetical protein A2149_03495 [Candidatus Schekmanbacteria bacterium RBG_16_38_11]
MSNFFCISKQNKFLFLLFFLGTLLLLYPLSVQCACDNEAPLDKEKADTKVLIYKSLKKIEVYKNNLLKLSHAVILSPYWKGKKQVRGDKKTPEGKYYICCKKNISKYNYFLGISYPNDADALQGLKADLITVKEFIKIDEQIKNRQKPLWNTKLGGYVGIHGTGKNKNFESAFNINWTDGCIALPDNIMEKVYELVEVGSPVTILP